MCASGSVLKNTCVCLSVATEQEKNLKNMCLDVIAHLWEVG